MMNWDQTDELNRIATDQDKSTEQRKSDIRDRMAYYSALYALPTEATNFALFGDHEKSDIDPSVESCKAKLPLIGQPGHSYAPGY